MHEIPNIVTVIEDIFVAHQKMKPSIIALALSE